MIIVMSPSATKKDIATVIERIKDLGYTPHPIHGTTRTVIGAIGDERGKAVLQSLEPLPGVEQVVPILKPYKLASREIKPERSVIKIAPGVTIGGKQLLVMAGPCSVESEKQILEAAHAVRDAGATLLRGGAFKPRSSPYSFQGLGRKGLALLARAREETGLLIVTEAMDPEGLDAVAGVADVIQIGARNMQSYSLLKQAGRSGKPVLLKRGLAATIQELLLSAEYILAEGNPNVILCERGVRSFDPAARNLLDLAPERRGQRPLHGRGQAEGGIHLEQVANVHGEMVIGVHSGRQTFARPAGASVDPGRLRPANTVGNLAAKQAGDALFAGHGAGLVSAGARGRQKMF